MSVFADASALVKLYLDEDGSDEIRRAGPYVVSRLSQIEVSAALRRKQRVERLAHEAGTVLVERWHRDLAGFTRTPVTTEILVAAVELVARHPLRGYDAVQLASAMAARDADPSCATLACFDEQLRRAAAAERFALIPA